MDLDKLINSPEWTQISAATKNFAQRHFGDVLEALTLHLRFLDDTRLPLSLSVALGVEVEEAKGIPDRDPYHTPDFSQVVWNGKRFRLTPKQRKVVAKLWEAWEDGTPEVEQQSLLDAAESDSPRLVDLFRGSPAWNQLVTHSGGGKYRLAKHKNETDDVTDVA